MWGAAARARSICGFSPGEFLVTILLVGIMISLLASTVPTVTSHVSQVEPLLLSMRAKIYWIERWANDGRDRPAAPYVDASNAGTYSAPIDNEVGDGSFGFEMSAKPSGMDSAEITFRPVFAIDPGVSSVAWICGRAPAPRGFAAVGENRTSLRAEQLVSACRGRQ